MIAKMTQYSFILLHGDKESFLSGLQQLGVVDITRSTKPVDAFSQSLLDNIATLRQDIDFTLKGSDPALVELEARRDAILKEIADERLVMTFAVGNRKFTFAAVREFPIDT